MTKEEIENATRALIKLNKLGLKLTNYKENRELSDNVIALYAFIIKVEMLQVEIEKFNIIKKYLHIETWQEDEEKTIQEIKCNLNNTNEDFEDFYKIKWWLEND